MLKNDPIQATIQAALTIGAVSTAGDFIWAMWIPRHRPIYGLTHGALLFLCIGLVLGFIAKKPVAGAIAGTLIGLLAAGSFYVLAPLFGYSIMFGVWFGMWIALAAFNGRLNGDYAGMRSAVIRGILAGVGSGLTFYLISGIWFPFRPRGWDYLLHFAGWTAAFLPGFAALLLKLRQRS